MVWTFLPVFCTSDASCVDCGGGESSSGITGGQMAGIAIGILAAIFLVVGGIWYYNRTRYSIFENSSAATELRLCEPGESTT